MHRLNLSNVLSRGLCAGVVALVAGTALGQETFHRSVGLNSSEIAYGASPTASGGYITAGRWGQSSTAPADILVTLYNECGEVIWQRVIGSINQQNDIGYDVRQTRDGGYVIAAETNSVSNRIGIALIKLDGGGNLLWSNVYAGTPFLDSPAGVALRIADDDTMYVVGRIQNGSGFPINGIMHRVAPGGVPVFLGRYNSGPVGATSELSLNDIVLGPNGPVVCGWQRDTAQGLQRAFLMLTDPMGVPGGASVYTNPDIATTADALLQQPNSYSFAGRFGNIAAANTGLICRVDGASNLLWSRVQPNWRPGFAAAEPAGPDTAYYGTLANSPESAFLRIDAAGNLVAGIRYGLPPNQRVAGHDLISLGNQTATSGQFFMAGETTMLPGNGQEDEHIMRTRPDGRSGCREQPFGTLTIPQIARQIQQPVRTVEQGFQPFPVFVVRPNPGNIAYCVNCCRADFNGDGIVSVQDIFDFLADWNSQSAGGPIIIGSADFNGVDGVTVQDIFDFLAAWNLGCP